ncbi:hypothetical protein [Streptomyces sp. SM12]|uniref:hypothetical protein n=1 Tax=Streptomyces sp. SM12 TaxID=1071602 RepID=UPI0015E17266|nr:hypothetical protein [Streptomyces sp. SM12]
MAACDAATRGLDVEVWDHLGVGDAVALVDGEHDAGAASAGGRGRRVQAIEPCGLEATIAVGELPTRTLRGYFRKIYQQFNAGREECVSVGYDIETELRNRARS